MTSSQQKMNPRIKKLWVKALKSRKYKKGIGQLRDKNDNFCALGVLCNLHAIEHPEFAAGQTDKTSYGQMGGSLPGIVKEWAGLGSSDPHIPKVNRHVSELNDSGTSFIRIANLIEKHL